MMKKIGLILILASTAAVTLTLWISLKMNYWILEPREKFLTSWKSDMALLEKSGSLPKEWSLIREIKLTTDNSPVRDWTQNLVPPITKNPNGTIRLEIFLIHQIEGHRYGVMAQYNLVDLKTNNTIWESGRTFKLGFVY